MKEFIGSCSCIRAKYIVRACGYFFIFAGHTYQHSMYICVFNIYDIYVGARVSRHRLLVKCEGRKLKNPNSAKGVAPGLQFVVSLYKYIFFVDNNKKNMHIYIYIYRPVGCSSCSRNMGNQTKTCEGSGGV